MKLAAGQSADVVVQFTNANGHPAKVQGEVVWESSDTEIVKVAAKGTSKEAGGGGAQATLTAGPKAGTATITATADADLGESGVTEVDATVDVEVIARGEAVGGEITRVGSGGPGGPVDPGYGQGAGGRPDQGLPGSGRPDNSLPEGERPTDPGYGKPDVGQGRPDQGLPGNQPGIDQGLPGSPNRPDQGLPPGATPKK
jgi:hypothetical protein